MHSDEHEPAEGLRERKRRETARRIQNAGMRLFIERGYDATTLDDIAAAADISRRTFFHYFKSKDDILLSTQSTRAEELAAALREAPLGQRPLDTVRNALLRVAERYPAKEMVALHRLMRSNQAVQARKQATYVEQENVMVAVLRERWPAPERATALKLVAMMAIGAMRLTLETFNDEDGKRPLDELMREVFDALDSEV